jgi:hypothetical protein
MLTFAGIVSAFATPVQTDVGLASGPQLTSEPQREVFKGPWGILPGSLSAPNVVAAAAVGGGVPAFGVGSGAGFSAVGGGGAGSAGGFGGVGSAGLVGGAGGIGNTGAAGGFGSGGSAGSNGSGGYSGSGSGGGSWMPGAPNSGSGSSSLPATANAFGGTQGSNSNVSALIAPAAADSVPEGGATIILLGCGLLVVFAFGRRLVA